jgi:hypothetical protein
MNHEQLIADLKDGKPVALFFASSEPVTAHAGEETNKSLKVHAKLRSREPIFHPMFKAPVIHDFATMTMPNRIAMDDEHGAEIGYLRPSLTQYGIEADGVVFHNDDDPQHSANRIQWNLRNNIPQQASIDFRGAYKVEAIPAGKTVVVNGTPRVGPLFCIRDWTLKAAAICKVGVDNSTKAEAIFSIEAFTVKETPVETPAAVVEEVKPISAEKPVEAQAEGDKANPAQLAEGQKPVEAPPAATPEPQQPDPVAALQAVAVELEQAKQTIATLTSECNQLKADKAALDARIATLSAGAAPVPPTPPTGPATYREALSLIATEHPQWPVWQVHAEAQKRFAALFSAYNHQP